MLDDVGCYGLGAAVMRRIYIFIFVIIMVPKMLIVAARCTGLIPVVKVTWLALVQSGVDFYKEHTRR